MKVRNKKTGEIIEGNSILHIIQKLHDRRDVICRGPLLNLDLFAEYWEEISETDPLIDGRKERIAIRTWADAVNITKVKYDKFGDCIYAPECDDTTVSISFDRYSVFEKLEHGRLYNITELCGK